MWAINATTRIYLAVGITDMRLGFNGLSALVEHQLKQSPLSGHLFAFCNRRRNRLKLLFWDGSGLWQCSKRLESGRFSWPEAGQPTEMEREEFLMLLGGLEWQGTRRKAWYRHRHLDRKEVGE